ncbi:hypothetical protein D3C86_525790 [compost metagenome]
MPETMNPYQELMLKAAQDEAFREALLNDPKATLEAHMGIRFPETFKVNVVTNTPSELTLVLPPKESGELSEGELDGIAGGISLRTSKDISFSFSTIGWGCVVSAIAGKGNIGVCRNAYADEK